MRKFLVLVVALFSMSHVAIGSDKAIAKIVDAAIEKGDMASLRKYITRANVDRLELVDEESGEFFAPIVLAGIRGNVEAFQFLLTMGSNPVETDAISMISTVNHTLGGYACLQLCGKFGFQPPVESVVAWASNYRAHQSRLSTGAVIAEKQKITERLKVLGGDLFTIISAVSSF